VNHFYIKQFDDVYIKMIIFESVHRVSMIIGCVVTVGSTLMYTIGKLFFDPRLRSLKNAPEIRDTSNSGYGYIEGPLHTDSPIIHNNKHYIRLDESTFHITTVKNITAKHNNSLHTTGPEFEKKAEFVHRTVKQVEPIFINNIDIGIFIKGIPLKRVDSDFLHIGDMIKNANGQLNNNYSNGKDHILGEYDKQVIGVEYRRSGIKAGKVYTIFGYYNADKQKMKKSEKYYNIISKQNRDELINSEERFVNNWNLLWGISSIFGITICGVSMIYNR